MGVLVRMPVAMYEHLDRAARVNWRTRTAEILQRLQASMDTESFDEHGCIVRHAAPAGNVSADPTRGGQS